MSEHTTENDRFGPPTAEGQRGYSISRLRAGSSKYGPCEVCGDRCDTTYLQTEAYAFVFQGALRWTRHNCMDRFGHRECLEASRATKPDAPADRPHRGVDNLLSEMAADVDSLTDEEVRAEAAEDGITADSVRQAIDRAISFGVISVRAQLASG